MKFENQNNYGSVPYPSEEKPGATVKTGGCGLVSSINVLRFFGITNVTVPQLAKVYINKGFRTNGGTSLTGAAPWLADTYGLTYYATDDVQRVIDAVKTGKSIAIMIVDGVKGIFSSAAHFLNIIGYDGQPPKPVIVFDVGYYAGRYDSALRSKYVSVGKDKYGNTIQFTTAEALRLDTANGSPSFWVFSKKDTGGLTMTQYEELKQGLDGLRKSVAALTDAVNALKPKVWNTLAEIPAGYRDYAKTAIDKGILRGTPSGLNATEELLRGLIFSMRMAGIVK